MDPYGSSGGRSPSDTGSRLYADAEKWRVQREKKWQQQQEKEDKRLNTREPGYKQWQTEREKAQSRAGSTKKWSQLKLENAANVPNERILPWQKEAEVNAYWTSLESHAVDKQVDANKARVDSPTVNMAMERDTLRAAGQGRVVRSQTQNDWEKAGDKYPSPPRDLSLTYPGADHAGDVTRGTQLNVEHLYSAHFHEQRKKKQAMEAQKKKSEPPQGNQKWVPPPEISSPGRESISVRTSRACGKGQSPVFRSQSPRFHGVYASHTSNPHSPRRK